MTVLVCTRDRAALLADCLRSLVADQCATSREIVVVDNGSSDGTRAVVEEAARAATGASIRWVLEPEPGLARARNRGVAEARGELLLFTDDDVIVQPGWTDALVAAFADPAVGATGGRILAGWPKPPPAWLRGPQAELLTLIDHGPEQRSFDAHEHPLGASFAVRAELARGFELPFDPSLGHGPAGRVAHEEVHLLNRIRQTHVLAYRPDAVVVHQVEEARMTLAYMRRAFFELGIGLGRRERLEGAPALPLPVRVVRAVRTFRGTLRAQRRNDRAARTGPETWEELRDYMWAGKHFEMLFGRFLRFTNWAMGRMPLPRGKTT